MSSFSLPQWLTLIENASLSSQYNANIDALSFIQSLHSSVSQPYAIAFYVLQNSTQAQQVAHFHALSIIRNAFIREFTLLSISDRENIGNQLLTYYLDSFSKNSKVTNKQCAHVLAVLLKRQWMATKAHEGSSFVSMLAKLVNENTTLSLPVMSLVNAMVIEFDCYKCAKIQMTLSNHISMHRIFEISLLPSCMDIVSTCLNQYWAMCQSQPDSFKENVLFSYLTLFDAILQWNFAAEITDGQLQLYLMESSSDITKCFDNALRPGKNWKSYLISSPVMETCMHYYHRLSPTSNCREVIRQCILRLASLKGSIFTDHSTKLTHAEHLVTYAISISSERHSTYEELRSISAIYAQVVSHFDRVIIVQLPNTASFLKTLADITNRLLSEESTESLIDTVRTDAVEALDDLLSAWCSLSYGIGTDNFITEQRSPETSVALSQYDRQIQTATQNIFVKYVQTCMNQYELKGKRIAQSAENAEEDHADDDEQFAGNDFHNEQLATVSTLVRIEPLNALSALSTTLTQCINSWVGNFQNSTAPSSNIFALHEHIYFLTKLLGHVLSDDPSGETPIIPTSIILASISNPQTTDPVQYCIAPLLHYLDNEITLLRTNKKEYLSPVVSSSMLWFFYRWCSSYLLVNPDDYSTIQLPQSFATTRLFHLYSTDNPEMQKIVHNLLDVCITHYFMWNEEVEVIESSTLLLQTLVGSTDLKGPIRRIVSQNASWKELRNIYLQCGNISSFDEVISLHVTNNFATMFLCFPSSVIAQIVSLLFHVELECESLVVQSKTNENAGNRRVNAFHSLLQPMEQRFQMLLSHPNFHQASLFQNAAPSLISTLNMIRGVILSTVDYSFNITFNFIKTTFIPLIKLFQLYVTTNSLVVQTILQMLLDIGQHQLEYLDNNQSREYMQTCLEIVKLYCENNAKRITSHSNDLKPNQYRSNFQLMEKELADDERYEEIITLLELLRTIVRKDVYDRSEESVSCGGEACFAGISLLTPLLSTPAGSTSAPTTNNESTSWMTSRMSTIGEGLTELLAECVSTHPMFVSQLDSPTRSSMFACFQNAILYGNDRMIRASLQCLSSLALWHSKNIEMSPFQPIVGAILSFLFHYLLFRSFSAHLIAQFSDTLFLYCVIAKSSIPQMINSIIAQVKQENTTIVIPNNLSLEQFLDQQLTQLLSGNNVVLKIGRSQTQRLNFRKNVREFVQTLRICLSTK